MPEYLIKSSACLALFLLFYTVFLEREKMHVIKRVYLLGAIILALGIPLVTITQYMNVPPELFSTPKGAEMQFPYIWSSQEAADNSFASILWLLYGMGVLVTGGKFAVNLIRILRRIRQNPKSRQQNLIRVLIKDPIVPHTFFNYIFFNIRQFLTLGIPKEVWLHEATHARQKHSVDVLILEFLQVVFWFNPLIYIYKRYVKSNHEFLADEGVLRHAVDPIHYQHTLLHYSLPGNQPQLANAINYSSIKKRITIMKRNTSKNSIRLRTALILPLLAGALYSFSDKVVVPWIPDAERYICIQAVQEKATPEMIAEYNALAKKYNEMSPNNLQIISEELERLEYIYGLMTDAQKNNAQPFPEFPAPPAAPRVLQGETSHIPAPPAAPRVLQGETSHIPPPPPPPGPALIAEHPSLQGVLAPAPATSTIREITTTTPVQPSQAVLPEIADLPQLPAPPSPPPNPVDHIKELAKTGAEFYYNDKPISPDKAIEMVKGKSDLNIHILKGDTGTPVVRLTDSPFKM